MTTDATWERIERFIEESDLPRKERKLDGLRRARRRGLTMELLGDVLLLDGTAIDPSELETGHWL